MTVHLLKLCVGVASVERLEEIQRRRLRASGRLVHVTRQTPRRAAEILDGGSLYWVIGGHIRVRQRITGIETFSDDDGIRRCALHLDPALVRTVPQARRPHQGWRYLNPADAPADLTGGDEGDLEIAAELKELGLW